MKKNLFILALLMISLSGFCNQFVWNAKANYPSFARHRCAAFSIGNKGYMGTGHINSGSISLAYTDWWEYDPATNAWTQKVDYPQARFACAGFTIGNKGYLGGGNEQNFGDRDEFYEFNPIANTWTQKANLPISNGGGFGFAINGVGYMSLSSALFAYNTSANTWTNISWSVPCYDYSSGFVINNKVYIVPSSSTTLYMWDPVTNTSTIKASCIGNGKYAACGFAVRGLGYIGLGFDGVLGNVSKDFYQYDPVLNSWDTIPKSFPGIRRNYVPSFTIGDNAYFGTGSNGTNLGDFWGYEWKVSVGVKENTKDILISIYPNPTSDFIYFKFSEELNYKELTLSIYSLDGKKISSEKISNLYYNISSFAKGTYFIQISNQENKTLYSNKQIIL
jgi:Secretion system C-terminal sorting domain